MSRRCHWAKAPKNDEFTRLPRPLPDSGVPEVVGGGREQLSCIDAIDDDPMDQRYSITCRIAVGLQQDSRVFA